MLVVIVSGHAVDGPDSEVVVRHVLQRDRHLREFSLLAQLGHDSFDDGVAVHKTDVAAQLGEDFEQPDVKVPVVARQAVAAVLLNPPSKRRNSSTSFRFSKARSRSSA